MSLKVLVIHNGGKSNLPSGELVVAKEEVRMLREKGSDANLYVISNDNINDKLSVKSAMASLNVFWSNDSFRKTKELIKRHTPDVVHFHSVLPLVTASAFYACQSEGIPLVQTLHNYRWFCVEGGLFSNGSYCEECLDRGPLRGVIKRCSRNSTAISGLLTLNNGIYVKSKRLFKLVDRFIAVSSFVKDKYVQAGFPEDKITVKYNATKLSGRGYQSTAVHNRIGVTFVGRLVPAKGTNVLKDIIRQIRDVPINIVGDGPDFEVLTKFCEAESAGNVNMMGRQSTNEVEEIMANSACVVVPSLVAETFGLVAIEAMACGTPVVASKIGGLAEIVEQSGGGVTVNLEKSSEDFVAAIREIINSPAKAREMGTRGRKFVEENFTMDKSVNSLLDIYNQAIEAKGRD